MRRSRAGPVSLTKSTNTGEDERHLDETEVRPQHHGQPQSKRGIPSKSENFNEWYPFIVEAAELVDKRYPIKGMDVWRPYGWKTMKLIDALTHAEMERTNHEEVNFPLLIPENLLEKEKHWSLA